MSLSIVMNVQKHLPYFPVPYPEECLYSVIARYHARSGNPTLKDSMQDLFCRSNVSTIASSITTPYHISLSQANCWELAGTNYTKDRLIREHTSYQFYVIRRLRERLPSEDSGLIKPSIQRALIHESGKMRYCPSCAREQRIIYGEPYWQRLPQLKGAEYCPIHGRPYVSSHIDLQYAKRHAITAAYALNECDIDVSQSARVPSYMNDIYIRTSKDINWLLNNGYKVQGLDRTLQTVADTYSLPDVWGRHIEEIALGQLPIEYVHKVFPSFMQERYSFNHSVVRSITPHQVAVLMGITAGSAERFAKLRSVL